MNQNSPKVIGIKNESRKDAYLSHVNEVEGLKDIFKLGFDEWSDFDNLESIVIQQWIFCKALDLYIGKKIDIKCDCCEYIDFLSSDFENIKEEKCNGKKSAYMIEKVLKEIVMAKAKREGDGTYYA